MKHPSTRVLSVSTALVLAAMLTAAPCGAASGEVLEGFDYRVAASPQPVARGGKVEVIEFFWYGCPYCNAMTPLIEPWAQRRRRDVSFIRVPYARDERDVPQQQLYYALEALGKVESLHTVIFQAIHEEGIPLKTAGQMAEFLEMEDIEPARFLEAFQSDPVRLKVERARQLSAGFGIDSVPTMVVDGRYITSAAMIGGGQADALDVVDRLVDRVQAARRAKQQGH